MIKFVCITLILVYLSQESSDCTPRNHGISWSPWENHFHGNIKQSFVLFFHMCWYFSWWCKSNNGQNCWCLGMSHPQTAAATMLHIRASPGSTAWAWEQQGWAGICTGGHVVSLLCTKPWASAKAHCLGTEAAQGLGVTGRRAVEVGGPRLSCALLYSKSPRNRE